MKAQDIFAYTAATALAFTPIAAQAGTRASDAAQTSASVERAPSPMADYLALANDGADLDCDDDGILNDFDRRSGCGSVVMWLLIGGVAVALITLLSGSENDASPGTGG